MRPWRAEDAAALLPILEANREHLGPWIPARVSTPVPLPELAHRLASFGDDFANAREFRYGLFSPDEREVLGEAGLYPRSATMRVPYADADRVELGYWLRRDLTGQGLITEATRALMAIAATMPRMTRAEIRCDARNAASAAIPRRLGFVLETTVTEPGQLPSSLQIWALSL